MKKTIEESRIGKNRVKPTERCPDCGCRVEDHNAVNRVSDGFIAHYAEDGACWRSLNTGFVIKLHDWLEKGESSLPSQKRFDNLN